MKLNRVHGSWRRIVAVGLLVIGTVGAGLAQEVPQNTTPAPAQTVPGAPTTTIADPAAAHLTRKEMKQQRQQQKHQEKAAKAQAKAQNDSANALKQQDKAQDEQEKATPAAPPPPQ